MVPSRFSVLAPRMQKLCFHVRVASPKWFLGLNAVSRMLLNVQGTPQKKLKRLPAARKKEARVHSGGGVHLEMSHSLVYVLGSGI